MKHKLTAEEKRISKKESDKKYYQKNKARIKEYNKKYHQRNKAKAKEYYQKYNNKNKAGIKEYNKQYRHCIGVDALPLFEEEAKKRQGTSTGGTNPQLTPLMEEGVKGESTEQAGKIAGVSRSYVAEAKRLKEESPNEHISKRKNLQEVDKLLGPPASPRFNNIMLDFCLI